MRWNRTRYYGKYRGVVVENIDSEQIGRIVAMVPDVLGEKPSSWAMPCVPAAGTQSGVFIVPAIGSQVWVEFEKGDPGYPIWSGGFWGQVADVPASASGFAHPAGAKYRFANERRGCRHVERRGVLARHRRHRAKKRGRCHDRGQRYRHLHKQRQGRCHYAYWTGCRR